MERIIVIDPATGREVKVRPDSSLAETWKRKPTAKKAPAKKKAPAEKAPADAEADDATA